MNKQTARLLEQHFDTAFAAPDGIEKLREVILTLAMQGKLVAQDPNDPPASELLKEIEKEKCRISREGARTRRKEEKLPPIKPDEIPYELPKEWKLLRIGDVCHDWGQKIPNISYAHEHMYKNIIWNDGGVVPSEKDAQTVGTSGSGKVGYYTTGAKQSALRSPKDIADSTRTRIAGLNPLKTKTFKTPSP